MSQEVLFVNTITVFQLAVKGKLNITEDTKSPGVTTLLSFYHLLYTKVTVLALQESTFPFLREEEYDFKAQQTRKQLNICIMFVVMHLLFICWY